MVAQSGRGICWREGSRLLAARLCIGGGNASGCWQEGSKLKCLAKRRPGFLFDAFSICKLSSTSANPLFLLKLLVIDHAS